MADLGLEFDPSEEKPFDEYVKGGGPLNLLEAVYCDPCKAKVKLFVQFCQANTKLSRWCVLW